MQLLHAGQSHDLHIKLRIGRTRRGIWWVVDNS